MAIVWSHDISNLQVYGDGGNLS